MSKLNSTSETLIADGTLVTGEINVQGDLRLDGAIKGSVTVGGTFVVTTNGKVEGDIQAHTAIIAGTIQGNIKSTERTVLEASSRLNGDLMTNTLVINEGARFQGNCAMKTDAAKK